ncbi:MAG: DUF4380 domain-containing protein [Clostridiales bacterium]|jgi:hypothetical protein|nr:DUF4380 domain-containing protein [Clostridiales bacterium]
MQNGKVTFSETQDAVFGKLIKITNGIVELMVTVDVGPRIIHFSRVGMENVLYQDKEKKPLGEPQAVYGGDIIKLYGGHRVWISPELMPSCYYPDNHPVTYKETADGNGMIFTAPVEKNNNIQKSIIVALEPDSPAVTVKNIIKNAGPFDIEIAPWAITMLAAGGVEIMPQPDRKTGYLQNKTYSFWDYADMNDPRLYLGKEYVTLRQDAAMANAFKLGYNNEHGWAAYFNKGQVFLKFIEPEVDGYYPDNGCCFETYTCDVMLEMETLGQVSLISPQSSVEHIEEWELYEDNSTPSTNDEAEIKTLMAKYIK